jgi:hypothetical protein
MIDKACNAYLRKRVSPAMSKYLSHRPHEMRIFRASLIAPAVALMLALGASGSGVAVAQAVPCANEQLRAEQPYGLELPDCRAYEMVSPLEKGDNDAVRVAGGEIEARAAVSGEAVAYTSLGLFDEPAGGYLQNTYLSRRGAGGWLTRDISPELEPGESLNTAGAAPAFFDMTFTPELTEGIVTRENTQLTSGVPAGFEESFLADLTNGTYRLISEVPGTSEGVKDGSPYESNNKPEVMGTSTDFSHIVYEPSQYTERPSVDEWINGNAIVVSVTNGGDVIPAAVGSGSPTGSNRDAEADNWHAVSSDAARIYMTSPTGEAGPDEKDRELYVRENAEQPQSPLNAEGKCTVAADACTIAVSASQRKEADPNGPSSTFFWGASANGSKSFFTSDAELTEDAKTGPADDAANLYEYDLTTGKLTDLSVDPTDIDGAGVLGVMQISEDGSYVYFVAEGAFAQGAAAGQANLYVSHDGGAPRFIATLENGTTHEYEGTGGDEESWSRGPAQNQAAISGDGTRLAFVSRRSLTGYDNELAENSPVTDNACVNNPNNRCEEVYLYDASTNQLICASCNPDGARPLGRSLLNNAATSVTRPEYRLGNLSEDGNRLFFETFDALVPHDSNGRQDVYQYENGGVSPVSDVAGTHESFFVDASASGNDVFIATADQLLRQDSDFLVDVYDARARGGFPVSVSPPECSNGDSCKGPVSPQPAVFGAPASATFSGAGNVASVAVGKPIIKPRVKPRQCKKGLARRHGKCLKVKRSKSNMRSKRGRK